MIDWTKYDLTAAKKLAQQFGDEFLREMAVKLHDLDLVDRGNLLKSLKAKPVVKNMEVTSIRFSYDFYGAIWQNGTNNAFGKGVSLEPRKWRSEAIESLQENFNQAWSDFYADTILKEIVIDSVQMQM